MHDRPSQRTDSNEFLADPPRVKAPTATEQSRGPAPDGTSIGAFIFDVDGVIADTDESHKAAWRQLAEEEGLPFNDELADQLRGLSREESLRRLLGAAEVAPGRLAELADRKNGFYRERLNSLTEADVCPGVRSLLSGLVTLGLKLAAVSVSRNARTVLLRTGAIDAVDIVIDGIDLARSRSKLNRFLLAARLLRIEPRRCVVVEDSTAGIATARAAGMRSVGVGDRRRLCAATLVFESLRDMKAETLVHWLTTGTGPE